MDRSHRRGSIPEALELWMLSIAARVAGEDCLREKRLTPKCDEPTRVQVHRVNSPEPHERARILGFDSVVLPTTTISPRAGVDA